MLAGLGISLILVMKLFPETPFARLLHRWLVEKPVAWFASARRHHIIFVIVMVGLLLAPETLMMLAAVDLSLITFALDLSLYIDAIIALTVIAGYSRTAAAWNVFRTVVVRRCRPAARARRRRVVRSRQSPANDDEDSDDARIAA